MKKQLSHAEAALKVRKLAALAADLDTDDLNLLVMLNALAVQADVNQALAEDDDLFVKGGDDGLRPDLNNALEMQEDMVCAEEQRAIYAQYRQAGVELTNIFVTVREVKPTYKVVHNIP